MSALEKASKRHERRARVATREPERARSSRTATNLAHRRLEALYAISKTLARFKDAQRTGTEVVSLLTAVVAVRTVIVLMDESRGPPSPPRTITWHALGVSRADTQAAMERARRMYDHLVATPRRWEDEEAGGDLSPNVSFGDGAKSRFVLLPLVVEGGPVFGALQLEGDRLVEDDLAFVNAAVNLLAVALDRAATVAARQHETETRRAAAESATADAVRAERQERFLSDTTVLLFSSLEYQKTLHVVLEAAVPLLADVCFVDVTADDGRVEALDVAFADPEKKPFAARLRGAPPGRDWTTPPSQVLRTGKSVFVESVDNCSTTAPDPEHWALLAEMGIQSMLSVPLSVRGRTLGVLTFGTAGPRRYARRDLGLAEEVARRAAIAIDNARLYALAQDAIRAREQLLAIVSHDLKNPLSIILTSVKLQLHLGAVDDAQAKMLDMVHRAALRMERIVADLLDLASLEAGHLAVEMTRQSVAALVQEAVDLHRPLSAEKDVRLQAIMPLGRPEVICDRGRILQVMSNLIGNAIKFTPRGGAIEVAAKCIEDDVVLSVADTGPGIPPADLPHVFDRYWQAQDTARLGTGLGLTIAKELVMAHHGRIGVESVLGHGATFHFTLPRAPPLVDASARP